MLFLWRSWKLEVIEVDLGGFWLCGLGCDFVVFIGCVDVGNFGCLAELDLGREKLLYVAEKQKGIVLWCPACC